MRVTEGTLEASIREALAGEQETSPVGTAVRRLLEDATRVGVSDIHVNPSAEGLEIQYRIDGVLRRVASLDPSVQERLVNRIKVISGLLTYRQDIPQDGKIPAQEAGGQGDVRVSILPTVHGEKAVLRFFPQGAARFRFSDLGLDPEIVERLSAASGRPEGVILLTGPSGSGKTTTIYALLNSIREGANGDCRHIVTIEDPVEQTLDGVTQTQVHPAVGLTFDRALYALLRQDPNVILVGEIRDPETAKVAMEAGLTGHLVISTVHAGAALGVVVRLLDRGVERHVLASAVSCVLAQRLVRVLCASCRRVEGEAYESVGCASCLGAGYRGRRVLAEFLEVTPALRDAIAAGRDRETLRAVAARAEGVSLREAGERFVREGVTSRRELERVLG